MPPPEWKDGAATCAVSPKHSHTQNRQKHMSVHLVMLMGVYPIETSFSGVTFSAWLPIFQGPSPNGSIFLRVLQKQHIRRPGLCANHGPGPRSSRDSKFWAQLEAINGNWKPESGHLPHTKKKQVPHKNVRKKKSL